MSEILLDDDFFEELLKKDKIQEVKESSSKLKIENTNDKYNSFSKLDLKKQDDNIIELKCNSKIPLEQKKEPSELITASKLIIDEKEAQHILKSYYQWLLKEGFVEVAASRYQIIMQKYHELSLKNNQISPLLIHDINELKSKFRTDEKYIAKLINTEGKGKVTAAKKYFLHFMKKGVPFI